MYKYLIINKSNRSAPRYQATTDHFLATVVAPSAKRAISAYIKKYPDSSVEAKPTRELTATQRSYVEKYVPIETYDFVPDHKESGKLLDYVITVKNQVVFSIKAKGRRDAITKYREQVDCPHPDAIALTQKNLEKKRRTYAAYNR